MLETFQEEQNDFICQMFLIGLQCDTHYIKDVSILLIRKMFSIFVKQCWVLQSLRKPVTRSDKQGSV